MQNASGAPANGGHRQPTPANQHLSVHVSFSSYSVHRTLPAGAMVGQAVVTVATPRPPLPAGQLLATPEEAGDDEGLSAVAAACWCVALRLRCMETMELLCSYCHICVLAT